MELMHEKNNMLDGFLPVCYALRISTGFVYLWGKDHDVYLGKLNASEYDSESIWNEYGTYGSEYSSCSPFNAYATYPPVLVDSKGNFYGYFTINKYSDNRANFDLANIICEYYEYIREDVSDWYNKIFD